MLNRILLVAFSMTIFGFIDNAVMIIAGDAIDQTISQTFGLSTMASAGFGNTLSDALGAALGALVPLGEGVELPVKWNVVASMIGITVGCLFGMVPLLLL